jgi:hypothetical protein
VAGQATPLKVSGGLTVSRFSMVSLPSDECRNPNRIGIDHEFTYLDMQAKSV